MSATRTDDKKWSVTTKLLLLVFAIVLLIIGIQTWLNIRNARQRNEAEAKQSLMSLYRKLTEDVMILEKAAAALSLSFASRPDIQERFAAQDRQGMLALLEPAFLTLQSDYDIVHLQFHESSGHIFLRIHDPEHYGDYTFTYRRANAQAIISRQTVAGIEIDPNRLGIQGVSPVFHQGQFVGLVEVGLDYDQAFLEDFKARYGADYKMWVTHRDAAPAGLGPLAGAPMSPSPELFYYAGTDPTPLPIPAGVYQTVLRDREPQIEFVSLGEQKLAVLIAPMLGYGDRMIGVIEISASRAETLAALQRDQLGTVALAGGLAILGLTSMWVLISRIVLRPLGHLTAVAQQQLAGDLITRVKLLPRDEFGQLGHTLNVLTGTLDSALRDQEDTIAERTARYRSIFEDSPISLWEADFSEGKRYVDSLRGSGMADMGACLRDYPEAVVRFLDIVEVLDVNQATLELFDAGSKEELLGGLGTVFGSEAIDVFRQELGALAEGKTRLRGEVTAHTLTGRDVHVVLSLAVAPGYEDTWSKVFLSIEDITERRRGERERERLLAQIQEQARQVQQIVDTVPVGVLLLDAEDKVVLANPVAQEDLMVLSNARVGDVLVAVGDYPLPELLTWPDDRSWHEIRADGQTFEVIARPVETSLELPGWVLIIRDVTQEIEIDQRIQEQDRLAAIGQLAGGVAHDFNNLLTAIQGYAGFVLDQLDIDDPIRADLQEIDKAADRAAALTNQLLIFSRKQVLQPVVLDLNAVIADMEEMLRRLIGEDIALRTSLSSSLGQVMADLGQIEQVIMNLSVNARDAMPRGGQLVLETANVVLDETYVQNHPGVMPGAYVLLAVSDTGVGMSEQVRAHIFEPFFTTKEKGRGTGLGLSMVHGIVTQSGGHVEVYSEQGVGTTFKIYLPRVQTSVEPTEEASPAETLTQGTETILLAEDEDIVRELTRRVLERQGYTVLVAHLPSEALALSSRHDGPISLLVSDVVMPEMGGKELAERLVSSRPEMRVLYVSGYTDDAIAHHGVLEPGVAYLEKPFTPAKLARKVREVLDAPSVQAS